MFGLNNAQLIGRLGADATISRLTNGGRVANVSIATDESFLDKNLGGQGGSHRVAPHRHLPGTDWRSFLLSRQGLHVIGQSSAIYSHTLRARKNGLGLP